MATAFSETESALIIQNLKACAQKYMKQYGIKKTSVDQLVAGANISKGSFYKFYPTKEILFFEVLEDLHTQLYQKAADCLEHYKELPLVDRLSQTFIDVFYFSIESFSMPDFENEAAYLMRKLPPEVLEQHMQDESVVFFQILEAAGIHLKMDSELFATSIRILTMICCFPSASNSPKFNEAIEVLIHGFCHELITYHLA